MRYVMRAMGMNLRRAAQYRSSFILQCLAQVVMTAGDLWAILLLLERFGAVGHWTLYEVLFFFGVMHCAFAVTEMINRGFGHFSMLIRMGTLDTMLTRPRSPMLQVILSEMDPRRIGTVVVGLTALTVATNGLGLVWHAADVLLILWAAAGTVFLMMGLFMLEACQYPIDVYPEWIRTLFMVVVPVALCLQFPVCHVLGKPLGGVTPGRWVWLTPLSGPAFFGVMALLWRWGLRHYRSTGS